MITTKQCRKDLDVPSTIPIWTRWRNDLSHRFGSIWNRMRGIAPFAHAGNFDDGKRGVSLLVGSQTTIGQRDINEDRCYADARRGVLLAVDGMGGHSGGEIASRIIIDTIPGCIQQAIDGIDVDQYLIQECVEQAIEESRREIIHYAEHHAGVSGMGATLALAIVIDDSAYVANIGDSRAYHWHGCELCRLTSDHSFVQALVDAGAITETDARKHPLRHVVTNFVGAKPLDRPPEIVSVSMTAGDEILLTTDGITDVLDDAAIRTVLTAERHPQSVCTALVKEAIANATKDNASCVVGQFIVLNQRALSPENGEAVSLLSVA